MLVTCCGTAVSTTQIGVAAMLVAAVLKDVLLHYCIALDKMKYQDFFSYFIMKTYVVGTYEKRLDVGGVTTMY